MSPAPPSLSVLWYSSSISTPLFKGLSSESTAVLLRHFSASTRTLGIQDQSWPQLQGYHCFKLYWVGLSWSLSLSLSMVLVMIWSGLGRVSTQYRVIWTHSPSGVCHAELPEKLLKTFKNHARRGGISALFRHYEGENNTLAILFCVRNLEAKVFKCFSGWNYNVLV